MPEFQALANLEYNTEYTETEAQTTQSQSATAPNKDSKRKPKPSNSTQTTNIELDLYPPSSITSDFYFSFWEYIPSTVQAT